MSNILRQFLRSRLLDVLGLFSNPSPGIHILNGHMINRGIPADSASDLFRSQMTTLGKKVRFIRFEEAADLIKSNRISDIDMPMVAFSFDDGFMENYTHIAPVLEEFNVNAAFFINPNYVDGDDKYIAKFNNEVVMSHEKLPMRWKEIVELHKRGHIIGAHTLDHFKIASDNEPELIHQIVDCRPLIESHINAECPYFAFPYGRLEHANKLSIDIACKTYEYVFSQSDYKHYFSFNGKVINRRHFEPFWPVNHVKYFLSANKH